VTEFYLEVPGRYPSGVYTLGVAAAVMLLAVYREGVPNGQTCLRAPRDARPPLSVAVGSLLHELYLPLEVLHARGRRHRDECDGAEDGEIHPAHTP
jgi:hypothetical protein